MKQPKGVAFWVPAFLFAIAVITVYKTFDNLHYIWGGVARIFAILTPFVIGFGLAFLLYAPVNRLEGWIGKAKPAFFARHARVFAIAVVYILLAVLVGLILGFGLPALVRGLVDFAKRVPDYIKKALDYVETFAQEYSKPGSFLENVDITKKLDELYNYALSNIMNIKAETILAYLKNILDFTSSLFDVIMSVIISVYMLASREALVRALKAVCGLFMRERWIVLCSEYAHKISKIFYGYLYSQLLDACLMAIIITAGLWVIGVPSAPLLGMLVGFLNLIPYFGAIIGGCFCVLITLLSGNLYGAIFVAVYIVAMQQIDGNIIQPRIVGSNIGIKPIYVLLAITIGGGLVGFWGIFLGVPVMAALQMVLTDLIALKKRKREERLALERDEGGDE